MRGKRIRKPETWTTENEISYLSGIGTWGKVALSRKEYFRGILILHYEETIGMRWTETQ